METRSQRRAAGQSPRPLYPQITTQSAPISPSSSVFQSAASLPSISTLSHQQQHSGMLQSQQHQGLASAPLPSPSTTQPASSYFGSIAQQAPTSHPSQQQRIPPQAQQGMGSHYLGQRGDGGGTPETAPFLKDFNLVAEAAKRAQMACLARDMGDVGL